MMVLQASSNFFTSPSPWRFSRPPKLSSASLCSVSRPLAPQYRCHHPHHHCSSGPLPGGRPVLLTLPLAHPLQLSDFSDANWNMSLTFPAYENPSVDAVVIRIKSELLKSLLCSGTLLPTSASPASLSSGSISSPSLGCAQRPHLTKGLEVPSLAAPFPSATSCLLAVT